VGSAERPPRYGRMAALAWSPSRCSDQNWHESSALGDLVWRNRGCRVGSALRLVCMASAPHPLSPSEPTKAQQAQPTIGALYCYAVLCYFATPYPERRSAFISVVRVLCVLSAAWAVVGWLATCLPCLPACLASAPLHLRSLAVDYKNEFGCSAAHWSATQVMRARVLICDCSPRTPQIRIPDGLHRNNT